jgi:hypothetical protein
MPVQVKEVIMHNEFTHFGCIQRMRDQKPEIDATLTCRNAVHQSHGWGRELQNKVEMGTDGFRGIGFRSSKNGSHRATTIT